MDFASDETPKVFAELVERAAADSFVYVDWSFRTAVRSGVFDIGPPTMERDANNIGLEAMAALDTELCSQVEEALEKRGSFSFGGAPDADNHHLLFEFDMRLDPADPFLRAQCEYVASSHGLRLRGFFFVDDIGTATAENYVFRSVTVPAHVVPKEFFKYGDRL